MEELQKAAEQGDAAAQYRLGICYDMGKDVSKDFVQAAAWYRKAAEQGHAAAQYYLGIYYSDGKGVPKDIAQAAAWYRKAAEQGHAEAQLVLGGCYQYGVGVPQDHAEAYFWFSLVTARALHPNERREELALVMDFRDEEAKLLSASVLAEAQRRVSEWKPRTNPEGAAPRP